MFAAFPCFGLPINGQEIAGAAHGFFCKIPLATNQKRSITEATGVRMRKPIHREKGLPKIFGSFRRPQGWLLLLGFLGIVSASAFLVTSPRTNHEDKPLVGKADLGQFPPYTETERELAKMVAGKDRDIDLALANWLIVADIPQFAEMTRDKYFSQLDAMVDQVRQEMARRQEVANSKGKNPNDPETRCGIFCGSVVKLGFGYAEQFRQHDLTPEQNSALHGNANSIFLAGLLRTHRGTCISMPLAYLVIGQRLGMPVHLVAIGKHYFIRWQEPSFRMNIETTIVDRVAVTADDYVYLEDEGLTRDQLRGSDLRNLTSQEVLGELLFTRSGYWVMSAEKSLSRSLVDLSRASHLAPEDASIQMAQQAIFARYTVTPADTLLTLQEKERNVIRSLAEALPRQAMSRPQQPPPALIPQPQPSSPATPAKATPQQIHQAPAATIPR
jgi:hypothetical protein